MARNADVLIKLGGEAARRFVSDKTALNDTISQYRTTMGLNDEEVRRVVENANRATFTNMWHSAPVNDRVITFPLADADAILGGQAKSSGMAKAASSEVPEADEIGFFRPRTDGYRASKRVDAGYTSYMEKGAELLMQKTASAKPRDLHGELNKSRRDYETARQSHTLASVEQLEARAEFRKQAALALRQHPVEHVVSCLLPFTKEAQAECLEAMQPEIDKFREVGLLKEGSFVAAEPNPEHPLVKAFQRFTAADEDLKKQAAAMEASAFEYHELLKEVGRAVRA